MLKARLSAVRAHLSMLFRGSTNSIVRCMRLLLLSALGIGASASSGWAQAPILLTLDVSSFTVGMTSTVSISFLNFGATGINFDLTFNSSKVSFVPGTSGTCTGYGASLSTSSTVQIANLNLTSACTITFTFRAVAAGPSLFQTSAFTTAGGLTPSKQVDAIIAAARPTITSVSPASGPLAGGTSVTITGTNFTGVTAVKFGSNNAASFSVASATLITAVSPAAVVGTVDITVIADGGTSAVNAADQFGYVVPLDSQRIRATQNMITPMVAQASGQAITTAVEGAISDGFSSRPQAVKPGQSRVSFNLVGSFKDLAMAPRRAGMARKPQECSEDACPVDPQVSEANRELLRHRGGRRGWISG